MMSTPDERDIRQASADLNRPALQNDLGSAPVPTDSKESAWSVFPEHSNLGTLDLKSPHTAMASGLIEQRWLEATAFGENVVLIDRYRLENQIGSGGMGIVFRATDLNTGEPVAIKVLKSQLLFQQSAWLRFQKEARVWQEVICPHVVRFLALESDSGQQFIVSEYVKGLSLGSWLDRYGKFSESETIRLFAEIASGLKSIHNAGIIHRDLTPGNILLETELSLTSGESANKNQPKAPPRIRTGKISDFGLAREAIQSQSMDLTHSRSLLGTPKYLAPEQYADRPRIEVTADLYSLGVSMFHAVIGRAPFEHEDLWQLADQHRFVPPPDPQSVRPELSNGLRLILLRLLEKHPEDRYQTADDLLADLKRLQERKSIVNSRQYFQLPTSKKQQRTIEFRWELESPIKELWPLVTQTNRVNRAMGLPAPRFTSLSASQPALYETKVKLFGMPLQWVEYPFCWVEGQMMSVRRDFQNGPYQSVISQVQLSPRPNGGSLLVHQFRFLERGVWGRWFANWQIGRSTHRVLDQIYRRLDHELQLTSGSTTCSDPFHLPVQLQSTSRFYLEKMESSFSQNGVPDAIRHRMEELLTRGPDDELLRIRVRRLAKVWKVNEINLLQACLLACQVGVLKLAWDVICPKCRASTLQRDQLSRIQEHEYCDVCQLQFDVEFSKNVELVFEISPLVRKVSHSVWCIGGPFHAPHVVAQMYLAPSEESLLRLHLTPGNYLLSNRMSTGSIPIQVSETSAGEGYRSTIQLNAESIGNSPPVHLLPSGQQQIRLSNHSATAALLRIERVARNNEVLSAAEARTHRSFREMFPNEVVSPRTLLSMENAIFLAVHWSPMQPLPPTSGGSTWQFDELNCVAQYIEPIIRKHLGELIELVPRVIVAVFHDSHAARNCCDELQKVKISNSELPSEISLRVDLQSGPAIVSHLLGYPKYFGQTMSRLLSTE